MDDAQLPAPTAHSSLDRTLQGGSLETKDDDPETSRPNGVVSRSAECEPLLGASCTRPATVGERAPHVQFVARAGDAERGSLSSSSSEESVSVTEARPPDGGWGWVVVFAAFMVNLIADGITFSFGIFYVHFLDYFGEGNAKTALIGGIFMAMPLLSGPIASFLTDRYGCRRMTVLGSLLAALGFVLSAFVDNMEMLFLTFGVMAGFGLSLCYVAAVVIVAYYFETKRSLATGISVCGSGIGTFLFAPLTRLLLDEYGWRGTTLVLAGAFLNMCACGLLMRDLPWTSTMNAAKARDRKRSRQLRRSRRAGSSADSFSESRSSAGAEPPPPPAFSSLVDLPTYVVAADHVPPEVLELLAARRGLHAALQAHCPALLLPARSCSDSGRLHEAGGSPLPAPLPAPRKLPPAFLRDLRVHRRSLTYRGAMLNISRYRLRASSCPNIYRNSMTTIAKEKLVWYAGLWDLWDLFADVLDLAPFAEPELMLFALSNFLLYTWYDVPYLCLADSVQKMGFSEQSASLLISIIGIVNMLGELVLGWAGDWQFASAGVIYALSMLLCGLVTALLPALTSYAALAATAGAFGFFIAANYSLTSIILVELISLENFTNAYGLLLLIQGIANLVGPTLAGWLYDVTASYDLPFYLAGLFIAVSGLILLVLPAARALRRLRARPAPAAPPAPTARNGKHVAVTIVVAQ